MKRNLKIFFSNGIPFGILMGILFTSLYGPSVGLMGGLWAGLVFGAVMFVVLGLLHSRAVKKITADKSEKSMDTYHDRDIKLQLPYDKTFELCLESLSLINRCKILEEDRSQGKIIAKTPVNWKTWGDTISFEIDSTNDKDVYIKVSSRPSSWTTLVDYGKNLENVETIASFLEQSSG